MRKVLRLLLTCAASLAVAAILLVSISSSSLHDSALSSPESVELLNSNEVRVHSTSSGFDTLSRASLNSQGVQAAASFAFARINQDREACDLAPFGSFSVWSARRQIVDGVLYSLELVMDTQLAFYVQVEQLLPGAFHPTVSSTSTDTEAQAPIMSHYQLKFLSHTPCDEAYKQTGDASSTKLLEQPAHLINTDPSSTWKATVYPQFHGLSEKEFSQKLGFKIPSPSDDGEYANLKTSAYKGTTLPEAYDVRDRGQHCKSFEVQDQQDCGGCFAFAAASALSQRLCQATTYRYDVNISPQDIISCYGDQVCQEGGLPLLVYQMMYTSGKVADWCAPYTAKDASQGAKCGDVCEKGIQFNVEQDTVGWITDSAEAIMEEILYNGAVSVGFAVHADFPMYRSGVYKVAKWAKNRVLGGHAVVITGWGVDPVQGPYWTCMNSWNKNWGENGFFKIARGRNEALLESYGAFFARPVIPNICPQTTCTNGGEILSDCTCKCFHSWQGDTCETCAMTCEMGTVDQTSCECSCYPGYYGKTCDDMLMIQRAYSCSSKPASFVWALHHDRHLSVGSYIQVFPRGTEPWNADTNQWETGTTLPLHICGTKEAWSVANSKCDDTGSIIIPTLPVGSYEAYLVEFLGKNEFGASRGYKPPLKLAPTIRVAESCENVMAGHLQDTRDELEREQEEESKRDEHVKEQIHRLQDAAKFMQVHPNQPNPPASIKAFPLISFHEAHFWISIDSQNQDNPFQLRICPASISTSTFFVYSQNVEEIPCTVVREFAYDDAKQDVISIPARELPSGEMIAELVSANEVIAASKLIIAHAAVSIVNVEEIAGGSTLRLSIAWQIEPAAAATDKDWIGIYLDDKKTHVSGFYTHSDNFEPVSNGVKTVLLRMGIDGVKADAVYSVILMPAGSTNPAASTFFQWGSK